MSIIQTVLVFVGIPAGVFALFAIFTLGPGAIRAPRYRPGGSWDYKPVWYLPHPEHSGPISELSARGALEAGSALAIASSSAHPVDAAVEASGGASGEW
jgi:hypothetical protein